MSTHPLAPRCVALVGPQGVGKTTLLESLLFACGALPRKGRVDAGTTVGDSAAEARAHQMSTEATIASAEFMGESWTFLDTPGSVEFAHEARQTLLAADAAIVVCEPSLERAAALGPILSFLDAQQIPHLVFVNKAKGMQLRFKDLLNALQTASTRPLVLREIPIQQGDKMTGVVDLVSERAWSFEGGTARMLTLPDTVKDIEQETRREMIEHLAELDDDLLAEFLEDITPTPRELWDNLEKDFAKDLIVPVFLGEALTDEGIDRLLKALRHEVPGPHVTAERLGFTAATETTMQVFKTQHVSHTGKVSWARVWKGDVADGQVLPQGRISGLYLGQGNKLNKVMEAHFGQVVGLGKLDEVHTGDVLTPSGAAPKLKVDVRLTPPKPVYSRSVRAEKRTEDVKLSSTIARLLEEDPSLIYEHDPETHQTVLRGQGAVHIAVAAERLRNRFGLNVVLEAPKVPYRETIKKGAKEHGRHKRQTGGHGQFADIHIEIEPRSRGEGFLFIDRVVGGAVPRNFIPAVERGLIDSLVKGPLGFPVVDVAVALTDGAFHAVDSSDMAFHTCAVVTMRDTLPKCDPVLLEPIMRVEIMIPRDYTSAAQRLVTGRRGHLLGYDVADGQDGWDVVNGLVPQNELAEFIISLRSETAGLGTFTTVFDHYQEIAGRVADQIVAAAKAEADA